MYLFIKNKNSNKQKRILFISFILITFLPLFTPRLLASGKTDAHLEGKEDDSPLEGMPGEILDQICIHLTDIDNYHLKQSSPKMKNSVEQFEIRHKNLSEFSLGPADLHYDGDGFLKMLKSRPQIKTLVLVKTRSPSPIQKMHEIPVGLAQALLDPSLQGISILKFDYLNNWLFSREFNLTPELKNRLARDIRPNGFNFFRRPEFVTPVDARPPYVELSLDPNFRNDPNLRNVIAMQRFLDENYSAIVISSMILVYLYMACT